MKPPTLLLDVYKKLKVRCPTGYPRPDGPPHPRNPGPAARLRPRQTDPANLRRHSRLEPGHPLSRVAAPGAARLDRLHLGRLRQKPPREILRAHQSWPQADRARRGSLGPHRGPHGTLSADGRIGSRMRTLWKRLTALVSSRSSDRELSEEIGR